MWAKEFEHNGIKYSRLSSFSIISNKYITRRRYSCNTGILGFEIDHEHLHLERNGILHIDAGFPFDGPSGPTLDTKNFMRGSLEHDPIYQLIELGFLPAWVKLQADWKLYKTCREDKMSKFRAHYVYEGVAKFAGFAILPTA